MNLSPPLEYCDAENTYRNLRFLFTFINKEFTKGVPSKRSSSFKKVLRKLDGHMGPAGFPGEEGTEKQELIIRLLAGEGVKDIMELEKDEIIIKDHFDSFFSSGGSFPFFELFLPHLHIKKTLHFESRVSEFLAGICRILRGLTPGEWVEIDGVLSRDNPPVLFADSYAADYIYYTARSTYENLLGDSGTYEENVYLDTKEKQHTTAVLPAARGICALLGAFGLADLRFDNVEGSHGFPPFDRIQAIRLTSLGAYVLGLSSAFSPGKSLRFITLSESSLIATAEDEGGLAFLLKMGEQIAEYSVRSDPALLFSKIDSKDEILYILQYLQEHCQIPMPQIWQEFIRDARNRCSSALQEKKQETVYQLPDHPELLSFLSTSEEAAALLFKAEGRRIILPSRNRNSFKKLLRKNGFFIE